jgi:putative transposase
MKIKPHIMLLMMLAGWINRHQQDMIEYLKEENKILREKLGKKRLLLNEDQRRRLAVLGHKLGRKVLAQICEVFSPDTILKWHRALVTRKYDGSSSAKMGRPQISDELRAAIIHIAKGNRDWGYIRIRGQLKYLGFKVSVATIANVLNKAGLEPQPDRRRKTTWMEFVKSHWQSLAACDFFTTEVYTIKGLTRYMVFVAIDYATRKVEIAGIVEQAYGDWMVQMARNITDPFCGFLKDKKYLIHDRDKLYTKQFIKTLKAGGIKPIKSMPLAPNFSPFIERFVRSIKSECLDRMLIFGEAHLRYCITEFVTHYHSERAHQGLDNNIIESPPQGTGEIVCQERIGGLLKFYRRAA